MRETIAFTKTSHSIEEIIFACLGREAYDAQRGVDSCHREKSDDGGLGAGAQGPSVLQLCRSDNAHIS